MKIEDIKSRYFESVRVHTEVVEDVVNMNGFFASENRRRPAETFLKETNKGKAIVELRNTYDDLMHGNLDIHAFVDGRLNGHLKLLDEIDKGGADEIRKVKEKIDLHDQKEENYLREIIKFLLGDVDSTSFKHFVDNFSKYVNYIEELGDKETAKKVNGLKRIITDEEGKKLDEVKGHVDKLEGVDFREFIGKLREYVDYLEKENDKILTKRLNKSHLVRHALRFEEEKKAVQNLKTQIEIDDNNWNFFRKKLIPNLDRYAKIFEERYGDLRGAKIIEQWKNFHENREKILLVLAGWINNMEKSNEYSSLVEKEAITALDGILEERRKELSVARAKAKRRLKDILDKRIKELEKVKAKVKKQFTDVLIDRKKKLVEEWWKGREEFIAVTTPAQGLINEMFGSREENEIVNRYIEELKSIRDNYDRMIKEDKAESEELLVHLKDMERRPFSREEITQIYIMQDKIRRRRIDISLLLERQGVIIKDVKEIFERWLKIDDLLKKEYYGKGKVQEKYKEIRNRLGIIREDKEFKKKVDVIHEGVVERSEEKAKGEVYG